MLNSNQYYARVKKLNLVCAKRQLFSEILSKSVQPDILFSLKIEKHFAELKQHNNNNNNV